MNAMLALFLGCVTAVVCTTDPTVSVRQGQMKGKSFASRNGREFFAFQGIPYARPPLGDHRFKAPEPADPWPGTLNATYQPSMCIQKNLFSYLVQDELVGSEDCLYLNVYTPKLPKVGMKNLPVMVWIAGGGFSAGHGGMDLYGPAYLMDKDVVVVTMNYRLGVLGFLSNEDDVIPGNYGLKDQVLALRWVQDNIGQFGGDHNRVTLFGESAGSVSVGLHLLSPLSKGLFHKAILESGSPFCLWGVLLPGLAQRRAQAVATMVGCPSNSKEMIECLRLLPAETFVTLQRKFFEWEVYPSVTFSPVVEKCHRNKDSFLCHHPLIDFRQVSLVPIIIGMNSGEGGLFASRLYGENDLIHPDFKDNFRRIVPMMLEYQFTALQKDLDDISNRLKERYFPEGRPIEDSPDRAVDMITGGVFLKGILDMARHVASPVHFYVYDYLNAYSTNTAYGPCPRNLGVSHGDELISLFNKSKPLTDRDQKVSRLMVDIWTNFASTDKLTIDGTSDGEVWPDYKNNNSEYLLIKSAQPVVSKKPFANEYKFWSELPLTPDFSGFQNQARSDKVEP